MTPNHMEEALFQANQEENDREESNHNYENNSIEKIPLLARNDDSEDLKTSTMNLYLL